MRWESAWKRFSRDFRTRATIEAPHSGVGTERTLSHERYPGVSRMLPEWIGTLLFLLAVGLSGTKVNEDFGDRAVLGYATLLLMIVIYAAAVGSAFV